MAAVVRTALLTGMLACAASLSSAPGKVYGAPATIETLAPSSKWNVNYGDDSCRLGRAFGTGEATTVLVIDRLGPGDDFRLSLAGKRFSSIGEGAKATLRFGPDEAEQIHPVFKGNFGKNLSAMIVRGWMQIKKVEESERLEYAEKGTDPEPLSAAQIAAVDELVISKPLRRPLRLALGSMKAPFSALEKCTNELLTRWGVDVARHATLARRVRLGGNRVLLTSSDYPTSALFKGAQGIVHFRLSVDEAGKATACHIQQSTRPPEFDAVVCKAMMRRAQLIPALDKDGKPLASFYRGTVIFAMPSGA